MQHIAGAVAKMTERLVSKQNITNKNLRFASNQIKHEFLSGLAVFPSFV